MSSWWMVRAGRGSAHSDLFLQNAMVLFQGDDLGPIPPEMSKAELTKLMASKHPDEKPGTIKSWANQLYRFVHDIKAGDSVVTYNQEQRFYYVGGITIGDYFFRPFPDTDMAHAKAVQWRSRVARDLLSVETRNSLGAIQTLFKLSGEVAEDLKHHLQPIEADEPTPPPAESDPAVEADLRLETVLKADAFIEDAISRLNWDQMEELVAGILRGMGYRARVSNKGADRGHDIFASPDGLGLQEPRIFAEVKHRKGTMGAPQIRAFLGGRRPGDRCLYVSTGGFTKEAKYEADRASVPIHLVDMPRLRELLVDNYENLDAETRALVPLRRLYWPA